MERRKNTAAEEVQADIARHCEKTVCGWQPYDSRAVAYKLDQG